MHFHNRDKTLQSFFFSIFFQIVTVMPGGLPILFYVMPIVHGDVIFIKPCKATINDPRRNFAQIVAPKSTVLQDFRAMITGK